MIVDLSWGRVGDNQTLTFAYAPEHSFYRERDRLNDWLLSFKLHAQHLEDLIWSKRQGDFIL